MRVTDIPLPDIMKKYLKIDDFHREGKSNRYKVVCPFHNDSSPSLVLFDKTDSGAGWDYHCYVCNAHGTAPTMLTTLKITEDEESAYSRLRADFNLELPEDVTIKDLCEFKGLDPKFVKDNGWADVQSGVAIPFYDILGNLLLTKIRTKYVGKDKYYYKSQNDTVNMNNIPYGLHWLDGYSTDVLYLTEGETDCITLRQAGIPAIGIMGTNGFRPEYAAYFERFDAIVVVRDNDAAGWRLILDLADEFPEKVYMIALPKGVKDINNYHQYRCNSDKTLFRAMFDTLPLLPATPQTFISAVKAGQVEPTEAACWQMVTRFKTTKADMLYYKDVFARETKTTKTVITACLNAASAKRLDTAEVEDKEFTIENNCYYKQVFRGDRVVQERISNFIIEPKYDVNAEGEITRVVDLINVYGKTAHNINFTPESLSAAAKFNLRCLAAGDYIFTGSQEDLFQLCVVIFNTPKRVVHSPRRIGRLDTGGWLFGNCGINKAGEVVDIDDGLVLLDDTAYAPRSIAIDDEGNTSDLPIFDTSATDMDIARVSRDFRKTFGNWGAWLALGWCVAGWFSDEIFAKYGYFPYLFVTGKRASGKSVFCTMLQQTYGFAANSAGMSIETPTNVGIMRYLSYRCSMPQWYDDYRNDVKRITMKDGMLLDIYNRHGAVKGVRDSAGSVRSEKVNGFLLLSGEDTPSNNALLTRCVTVTLSAWERDPDYFIAAQEGMVGLHNYALRWARDAALGNTAKLFAKMDECYKQIFRRCGDARYAGNVSIFLGAFLWAFGDLLEKPEINALLDHVYDNSAKTTVEQNAEHPLAQFFNDFPSMMQKGLISMDVDYKMLESPKRISFRLNSFHDSWTRLHSNTAPISRKTLKSYIEKEPFYLGEERMYFDVVGRQRSMILNLAAMEKEFPDFVDALLQGEHVDY